MCELMAHNYSNRSIAEGSAKEEHVNTIKYKKVSNILSSDE